MNLHKLSINDQIGDLPEVYNSDMTEIEKAINNIMFEIARINDDIAHLKILTREDDER